MAHPLDIRKGLTAVQDISCLVTTVNALRMADELSSQAIREARQDNPKSDRITRVVDCVNLIGQQMPSSLVAEYLLCSAASGLSRCITLILRMVILVLISVCPDKHTGKCRKILHSLHLE